MPGNVSFCRMAAIIVMALLCASCTPQKAMQAAGKMAKIAVNPDLPIGPPKDQPSVATVTIYAAPGANSNDFGQSTPVDVWVFQLSDNQKLMSSDFMSVTQDPKGTLAGDYVSHKEKQVKPGESVTITDWKLNEDTQYIGVAVGFSAIGKANWRAIEGVKASGETYNILVPIRAKTVAVQVHR